MVFQKLKVFLHFPNKYLLKRSPDINRPFGTDFITSETLFTQLLNNYKSLWSLKLNHQKKKKKKKK